MMSDPQYIRNFIKAVYPEMTELAQAVNTEETLLKDATALIKQLRSDLESERERLDKLQTLGGCDVRIYKSGELRSIYDFGAGALLGKGFSLREAIDNIGAAIRAQPEGGKRK